MSTPLLKAEGLGIQFGGLKAVDEFNFEIDKNQLFGLIGPNGAGKTTVFSQQVVVSFLKDSLLKKRIQLRSLKLVSLEHSKIFVYSRK